MVSICIVIPTYWIEILRQKDQIKSGLQIFHISRQSKEYCIYQSSEIYLIIALLHTRPEQNMNLVLSTIRAAKRKEKVTAELQLHSDQGFQYTSNPYYRLTQAYNITPSMSRKGNPYDNAMAENFFSILKTECIHRIKLNTYDEASLIIDEYIHFYNNERIQLKTKLTPLEKRNQFVA